MTDLQLLLQIVNDEEEFEIDKILKKKLIWQREEFVESIDVVVIKPNAVCVIYVNDIK